MLLPRQPSYYEILNLSQSSIDDAYQKGGDSSSHQLIKRAYRRALLSHHPDKQQQQQTPKSNTHPTTNSNTNNNPGSKYTIDQISQAYAILSSPSQRSLYDRQLRTTHQNQSDSGHSTQGRSETLFQTGIENVDLDDLQSFEDPDPDPDSNLTQETKWYRSCRCGNPRGYLFSESDLEEAADLGELMVGCADCSLWLRVHFAVLEDEEVEEEEGKEGKAEGRAG